MQAVRVNLNVEVVVIPNESNPLLFMKLDECLTYS